jgi:hypothetical protein
MTTIEFLQQEWINDGNFVSLGKERDPYVGLHEEGLHSRSLKNRSGVAYTESNRSMCFAVASTPHAERVCV